MNQDAMNNGPYTGLARCLSMAWLILKGKFHHVKCVSGVFASIMEWAEGGTKYF
jgi:hypothetical protein